MIILLLILFIEHTNAKIELHDPRYRTTTKVDFQPITYTSTIDKSLLETSASPNPQIESPKSNVYHLILN